MNSTLKQFNKLDKSIKNNLQFHLEKLKYTIYIYCITGDLNGAINIGEVV